MENQHKLIKGYRELTNTEIQLMNEIKEQGLALQALNKKVQAHISDQFARIEGMNPSDPESPIYTDEQMAELERLKEAGPGRWLQIGWTHFQEGLMATTRAVAQPTFP